MSKDHFRFLILTMVIFLLSGFEIQAQIISPTPVTIPPTCILRDVPDPNQSISGLLATTDCYDARTNKYFDDYSFTVAQNDFSKHTFRLSSSIFSTRLELYNSAGKLLVTAESAPREIAQISERIFTPGTYTIKVTSVAPRTTGSYNLSYTKIGDIGYYFITGEIINLSVINGLSVTKTIFDNFGGSANQSCSIDSGPIRYNCALPTGARVKITPSHPTKTFSPPFIEHGNILTNVTGEDFTAQDAFLTNISISGTLRNVNGRALPSTVQAILNVTCGTSFNSNFTVSGSYSISVPANLGNCRITPQTGGASNITSWNPYDRSVTVGTNNISGVDFTAASPLFNVVGTINGLTTTSGVNVSSILNGTGTTTACDFNTTTKVYTCSGLVIYGDYTIQPSQTGTTFSPPSKLFSVITSNFSNQNFTASAVVNTRRTMFDFDADGKADISVFRPSTGIWYLQQSTNGFLGYQFGISTDNIVPADYDGDGRTDIAVYRPSNGTWYLQRSSQGFLGFQFGISEDIPVPADYDGDGKADIAVFRPSTGVWYIQRSSQGFLGYHFGISTDKPVPADYDGDGKADIAVYRPSTGVWYLQQSSAAFSAYQFGISEDIPVPADYDGDGRADIAVYRPSNGTWYQQRSGSGFLGIQFGISTDKPATADYDGDGRADIAVYRPSNGTWYLQRSSQGFLGFQFGISEDKAIPNAFMR